MVVLPKGATSDVLADVTVWFSSQTIKRVAAEIERQEKLDAARAQRAHGKKPGIRKRGKQS